MSVLQGRPLSLVQDCTGAGGGGGIASGKDGTRRAHLVQNALGLWMVSNFFLKAQFYHWLFC